MPHLVLEHATDPRADLLEQIGDISGVEIFHNNVVVAIYRRPEKTRSGIILPDSHREEDTFQSKIGLVIQAGPQAFQDDSGNWTFGDVKIGDWVVFRPSDGWNMSIRGKGKVDPVQCRRLKDTSIEGKVSDPDMIW